MVGDGLGEQQVSANDGMMNLFSMVSADAGNVVPVLRAPLQCPVLGGKAQDLVPDLQSRVFGAIVLLDDDVLGEAAHRYHTVGSRGEEQAVSDAGRRERLVPELGSSVGVQGDESG